MVHSTKSRLFAFVLAAALVCSALCGCARLDYDHADRLAQSGDYAAAAWKNGTLAALSAEDAALYEETQAIVSAAKAASGGDPLAPESYLYNYVSLAAVYDGSANEPVRNAINPGGQWYWVDLTFDNNVENFVEGANTHVFLNFTASRDTSRALRPNSECVSVASSIPSQYDYDATDYALYCRNTGIDLVDFAVADASVDYADLSAAPERTANAHGIGCSWYCASYPADDRVGFVVRRE